MSVIFINQQDFNDSLNRIKSPAQSIVGQLNTRQAPDRSFPSVREQFELLQRICDTLQMYQSFLEGDIASCKEFGEAYFALDREMQRQIAKGSESLSGSSLAERVK